MAAQDPSQNRSSFQPPVTVVEEPPVDSTHQGPFVGQENTSVPHPQTPPAYVPPEPPVVQKRDVQQAEAEQPRGVNQASLTPPPGLPQPPQGATTPPPGIASSPQDGPAQQPATPPPPSPGRRFPKFSFKAIGAFLVVVLLLAAGLFLFNRSNQEKKGNEAITLTYWGLWEDSETLQSLISEYEEKNPNVDINYVKQAKEDYRERLQTSLSRGTGPDIFRYHNTWTPMLKEDLAPLPVSVMSAASYQETFYPVAVSDLRVGPNIVGIPLMIDGLGLYINEEVFANEGKAIPTTWEELRKTAQELTLRDDQGRIERAGVAMGLTSNVDGWQDVVSLLLLQNGVNVASPSGKLAEDALVFYTLYARDVGDEKKVWDETLPPSTAAFAGGKLAMYFGPSWRAFEIQKLNSDLRFKIYPVPQHPKTNPQDKDINWASYWAEGVWKRSPNQSEAWRFLAFLSSKESLQKLYQASSATRLFGEPYPRRDMTSLLEDSPYLGAYIKQAETSKSWYLASRTFDGETGINSRISAYFQDALNAISAGTKTPERALETVTAGVRQVLSDYGI